MPDSQRNSLNLSLIKNVKDIFVFLALGMFTWENFPPLFSKVEIHKLINR